MKMYVLLTVLLCLALGLQAQQIVTVRDGKTGKPIANATILSQQPRAFAVTNMEGKADISAFEGSQMVRIQCLGYEPVYTSYNLMIRAESGITLEPNTINVEEVVVAATRWRQRSGQQPAKIISIRPEEVALQNPQTAADLLGISGKVFIQKSQQGGGSPMIRGFSTNRLLYAVDGVRMNTAIFRSGNLQNVISLDPFATESAEVLFGPGSVIYGSDAIGGVMSFQTLTPQFSLSGEPYVHGQALARYASANNEMTAHAHVNLGFRDIALVTSISSFSFDDLRMGRHGPDDYLNHFYVQQQDTVDVVIRNDDPRVQRPSGYDQMNLMQKVRYRPSQNWELNYGFHYSETSDYGRYDRHQRFRNGAPRYAQWDYGPQLWMMNNLNINHSRNSGIFDQVTLRLAQQRFEESRIDRSLNDPDRSIREEAVDAYSVNLDFIKSSERNQLFYGVEYVRNDVQSSGLQEDVYTGAISPGPARYPQSTWQSFALYVNDQFEVSEKLNLQAGVRYNQFMLDAQFDTTFYPFPFTESNLNEGALTGSLGLIYRPNYNWVISTNLSTGFRSPNVDDIGKLFDSEPGSVVVPNPDLAAEYAYNADLSIARVFGESLKIDVTGFYTQLENAMVRRDFVLNGQDSIVYDGLLSQVQALQNAARANVYGVQAGIEVRFAEHWNFSSDFNWQVGEEELDDGSVSASRHAAPWFGMSRLTFKQGKVKLQLNAQYQGERSFEDLAVSEQGKDEIYAKDENGNPYAPAWYTLNFRALVDLNDGWQLSAGIENLTDQRYRPYSSGLSGAGRNFVTSLRVMI